MFKRIENGTWKDVNSFKRIENGAWQDISSAKRLSSGAWVEYYPNRITWQTSTNINPGTYSPAAYIQIENSSWSSGQFISCYSNSYANAGYFSASTIAYTYEIPVSVGDVFAVRYIYSVALGNINTSEEGLGTASISIRIGNHYDFISKSLSSSFWTKQSDIITTQTTTTKTITSASNNFEIKQQSQVAQQTAVIL